MRKSNYKHHNSRPGIKLILFHKLVALFGIIALLSSSITLLLNSNSFSSGFMEYQENRLVRETSYVRTNLPNNWEKLDEEGLDGIAILLGANIIITNKNAAIIYISDNSPNVNKNNQANENSENFDRIYARERDDLADQLESTFNYTKDGAANSAVKQTKIQNKTYILAAQNKKDDEGHVIGTIFLARPIKSLDLFINTTTHAFIFGGLIALVISILFALFSSRMISKPINNINAMATQMAQGQFNLRVTQYPNDEIGMLAVNFNNLSEKIEKLEKMRNDYLANVSHELKTPLTGIRGLIEPIMDGMIEDEQEKAEYLKRAHAEIMRLTVLINDILKFSRYQNNNEKVDMDVVDINRCLAIFCNKSNLLHKESGIKTRCQLDEKVEGVMSNEGYIIEIISIFAQNAYRFTNAGGQITFYTKRKENSVRVGVRDTGIGVSEEQQQLIFERFYQVNERKNLNEGLGIGLSIAKVLAGKIDAQIGVESQLGVGSDFFIEILNMDIT